MNRYRVKVKIIAGKASRKGKIHEFCIEAASEADARRELFETQKHLYLTGIRKIELF